MTSPFSSIGTHSWIANICRLTTRPQRQLANNRLNSCVLNPGRIKASNLAINSDSDGGGLAGRQRIGRPPTGREMPVSSIKHSWILNVLRVVTIPQRHSTNRFANWYFVNPGRTRLSNLMSNSVSDGGRLTGRSRTETPFSSNRSSLQ